MTIGREAENLERGGGTCQGRRRACLPRADALTQLTLGSRAVLMAAVAGTGGRLGTNLGVVEVRRALGRVFASARDAIGWDTGRQSYVDELVTGRRESFGRLRRAGG